jgi:hypothetical protein
MTWWDSGKASDIFGLYKPTVAEENEDAEVVVTDVTERLKRCRLAYQSTGGWRQLIDHLDCKSLYTRAGPISASMEMPISRQGSRNSSKENRTSLFLGRLL